MNLIQSICVDTLTGIQSEAYMRDKRKAGHDKWKDYGQAIYTFISDLQILGFEIVLILGDPGTGKSSGMRTLSPKSNIWYNADNKNPVWTGGKAEYGRKNKPISPYHIIPKSYKEIVNHIQFGLKKGMFSDDRVAFLTGHTEIHKEGNDSKIRLKTLGKLATNMQLEGKLETVLYAKVEKEDDGTRNYILETQNDGFNTARSPMGMFEEKIPNDYKLVLDKVVEGI
jgi:hypothetical protein